MLPLIAAFDKQFVSNSLDTTRKHAEKRRMRRGKQSQHLACSYVN